MKLNKKLANPPKSATSKQERTTEPEDETLHHEARDVASDEDEWGETETGGGEEAEPPAPRGSIEEGLKEIAGDPRVFAAKEKKEPMESKEKKDEEKK